MTVKQATLRGADRVRLVLALSRARLDRFTHDDWAGWCDAVGDAHRVRFHADDDRFLREALGLSLVDPDYVFVVLDDSGITWNVSSPVNSFAWQVRVVLDVEISDVPEDDYWRPAHPSYAERARKMAALPPQTRRLVLACPEQAQPYVLEGYLEAWRASGLDKDLESPPLAPGSLRAGQISRAVPDELRHPWPVPPGPPA